MRGYLAALDRLAGLDLDVICPGHGPLVLDPAAKLRRVPRAPARPRAAARRGPRRRAADRARAPGRARGPTPRRRCARRPPSRWPPTSTSSTRRDGSPTGSSARPSTGCSTARARSSPTPALPTHRGGRSFEVNRRPGWVAVPVRCRPWTRGSLGRRLGPRAAGPRADRPDGSSVSAGPVLGKRLSVQPIRVTHFTDPGCPWAYSAWPALAPCAGATATSSSGTSCSSA